MINCISFKYALHPKVVSAVIRSIKQESILAPGLRTSASFSASRHSGLANKSGLQIVFVYGVNWSALLILNLNVQIWCWHSADSFNSSSFFSEIQFRTAKLFWSTVGSSPQIDFSWLLHAGWEERRALSFWNRLRSSSKLEALVALMVVRRSKNPVRMCITWQVLLPEFMASMIVLKPVNCWLNPRTGAQTWEQKCFSVLTSTFFQFDLKSTVVCHLLFTIICTFQIVYFAILSYFY